MKRYIILGDGLLGSEIQHQTGWDFISRKSSGLDFDKDFNKYLEFIDGYDTIVNCIAFTKTYSDDRESNITLNCNRVFDLVDYCNTTKKKLVHISTDYLYSSSDEDAVEDSTVPVHGKSWYGYSKLVGDAYVQMRAQNYLLLRTSFKPNPFPFNKAVIQCGNFDYVNVIAELIIKLINSNSVGLFNVGTDKKTMFELGARTRDDMTQMTSNPNTIMPTNVSMSTQKMQTKLTKPFISVVIPCWSMGGIGDETLKISLDILSCQTFKDFEVVVSDHSVDDKIKNLCCTFNELLNIKYFRNENHRGNPAANANYAITKSNGVYIKTLWQDDFLKDNESLEKIATLCMSTNCEWMFSKYIHSSDRTTLVREYTPYYNDIVFLENTFGTPSALAFKNRGDVFFDERLIYMHDCELYKRMYDKYGHPQLLKEITMVNYIHSGQTTNSIVSQDMIFNERKLIAGMYPC